MEQGKFGVLTVSDRVHRGESEDKSGPAIVNILENLKIDPSRIVTKVVPDEVEEIKSTLIHWTDELQLVLILTTGGTGFSPRDVTPEATKAVIEKDAPGITTAMLVGSLKVTPHAMLSRPVSGIRKSTLIVNLPGSSKAVTENLEFILPALPHALSLLRNLPSASEPQSHQFKPSSEHSHHSTAHSHEHSHGHSHSHSHEHSHTHSHGHSRPGRRVSPWPMLPVDKALEIVLSHTECMPIVQLPFEKAVGYVVAEDIKAKDPLPPFRASIKDGYAVIAKDGVGTFPVRAVITAGSLPDFKLESGMIARITTGSALPEGADAVVMVENTELLPDKDEQGRELVKILQAVKEGTDIRPIGSDIAIDEVVLKKGEKLGAAEIGLLATVGVTTVPVYGPPRVAVLSTGDELVGPEEELTPGHIRDSNRSMLLAALREIHPSSVAIDLGISRDTPQDLEAKVKEGLSKADVLITTGGVSMGELDLMQPLLEKLGKIHFGRILMKPGKPLTFATVEVDGRKKLVFGLPGNPVSTLVTFYLFVVPTLRKLSGHANPHLTSVQAKVTQTLALDPERPEYHRCIVRWKDGVLVAESTGRQASSRLLSMRSANAFLVLPQQKGVIEAGSMVPALLLKSDL